VFATTVATVVVLSFDFLTVHILHMYVSETFGSCVVELFCMPAVFIDTQPGVSKQEDSEFN